ncbi:S-adenosyl-l-methionine hydroxide adenosyltransferase family protein [Pseudoflavitalea sp. G-6-1-2]|uniref:SAM hydrolase/SAM-dependent halogenase family protein n=1 Tax=Pseudoflavitalea sp. G-6-1-2 TaxID=2728841 RepID=UPI00146D6C6F|nr:S-adenosyl-l-methionine hydroxide adenosyltransferase family protein [Pseudoflavitalea sp. G-6-1-2]NML23769.1 S-adenosyl-l-methionine hydroxide adenosyltransferase family protein [Pseudoflavitalea sp. G-6-1-2]
MKKCCLIIALLIILFASCSRPAKPAVVFQSDFGLKDGAVSAMKGVASGVSPELKLYDLTHEIPAYNIWEAAYRLEQTAAYWPKGTVFVSVVDPGVGTVRKSVVMLSKSGHYFVTPDNGTLTLVAKSMGIAAVREIDEAVNRRSQSNQSYTFHGRDVYAFTGARLAAGVISFEQVGKQLPDTVISIPFQQAAKNGNQLSGMIPVLDVQYGNIWTNIPDSLLHSLGVKAGDSLQVQLLHKDSLVFNQPIPFVHTFGDVPEGNVMAYINSLMQFSVAINMGNFASHYQIGSGPHWKVKVEKASVK